MAEFILTKLAESVLSQTVERITELLIHEAASLKSVRDDVVLLQDELESLKGFIKSADAKQHHDEHLQRLVLKVKDVASDAEDVIETYIHKVASSYNIKAFHSKRIRAQINFVRERIKVIFQSLQAYGITSVAAGESETSSSRAGLQQSLRRSSPNEEDKDVIILEDSFRALTTKLTKEEDRLCIVSVVGMGGLGKTTLAKKVFNNIKNQFKCSAWAFVSQRFVPKDIFIEILTQLLEKEEKKPFDNRRGTLKLNALKQHELIDLLKKELEGKKYLVVFDDIWTIEAWDSVKHAFPQEKNGSRLLFTTRNKEVATSADPSSSPIEPQLLTLDQSWKLLQQKAFPSRVCPPEFKGLGMEMAKKCEGLPLAVIVLGGLLRAKNSLDKWEKVLRDVNLYLNKVESHQQYEGVNEILALSYYDLPYYLKPCFLYLSNYPEDYEICKNKLVRLWIGEGFIKMPTLATAVRGEMEQTLEDVAEGYLEELIHRCMIQVDQRDCIGRGVKTCRMHDLMRDLCTSKAREESFVEIIQQHDKSNMWIDGVAASFVHLGSTHSRRLVIHPNVHLQYHKTPWACITFFKKLVSKNNPQSSSSSLVESRWVDQVHSNLHSLLCFGGILPLSALKSSNFKMLRVLELHVACVSSGTLVIGGMGSLIHLRYLCLKIDGENISLSFSIGNLRNLHTLHIESNSLWGFKGSIDMISRLIRLRHLLLPFYLPKKNQYQYLRIDNLKDIETLKHVPGSVLIRNDALHKLTNLRKISIYFDVNPHVQDEVTKVLGSQIVKSGRLTSLRMYLFNKADELPSLESLSSCHSLSKLALGGRMPLQQGLIHLPKSLTKLILWNSHMKQDPVPELENKLPNLRILLLANYAYVGSTMVFCAHGFPKLESLELYSLTDLRKVIVNEGAMPSLEKLCISNIPNLEMILEGIEFLTSLKELIILSMSESFCEKLQVKNGIAGEDFHKVNHIPYVYFPQRKLYVGHS